MADKEEMFLFLDQLREQGSVNMFGARPYLSKAFDLKGNEAAEVLGEWMESFRARHHREANAGRGA